MKQRIKTITPTVIDTTITTTPVPVSTIEGGVLPDTASDFYRFLLLGIVLTLVGAFGLKSRKRYE